MQSHQPVPFPLGVADEGVSVGYVGIPGAAIEAVDLDTGELRWRREEALRPLLCLGTTLICWRPDMAHPAAVALLWLDAENGATRLAAKPLALPSWVDVTDSFDIAASAEANSLVVRWRAETRYRGGAPPPEQVLTASRHSVAGEATLDLHDAALVDQHVRDLEEEAPQVSEPYWRGERWSTSAWSTRGGMARFGAAATGTHAGQHLWLKPSGGAEEALRPLPAQGEEELPWVTLDGRFVLVPQQQRDGASITCQVIAADSGESLATLQLEAGFRQPQLFGAHLYYLADIGDLPCLVARALRDGAPIWRHPLGQPKRQERPPLRP